MKKLGLSLTSMFMVLLCFTQVPKLEWVKSMGDNFGEAGNAIAIDVKGNVYTTGFFYGTVDFDPNAGVYNLTSLGSSDVFISKSDSSGNFIWARRVGNVSNDEGYDLALDSTGNVYITGEFVGSVDFDPGTGTFYLNSAGNTDDFILKLNSVGNFLWAKRMGGTSADFAYSIALDTLGNIYTTGSYLFTADFDPNGGVYNLTSAGGADIFISKLDSSGNFVWAKSAGGTSADKGNSLALDLTGNIYITGQFGQVSDFDPGSGTYNLTAYGDVDIFILKLFANGNFGWVKRMGGAYADIANSITLDVPGNVIITGTFEGTTDFDPGASIFNISSSGLEDIFVAKLDPNGNFVWAKKLGGNLYDRGSAVSVDGSGNIYTTGWFRATADFDPNAGIFELTSAGNDDIFISKLNSSGVFEWARSMGGISFEEGKGITLGNSGKVYTTGYFQSTVDFNPGYGVFNLTGKGGGDIFIHTMSMCQPSFHSFSVSGCDTFKLNGVSYYLSGLYFQTLTSATGCDSILSIDLTINHPSFSSRSISACSSYTFNNQTYTTSGMYKQTLVNALGCDSIITLSVTIRKTSSMVLSPVVCSAYFLNGQVYSTTGIYTQTLNNFMGCDSVITINLTVKQASFSSLTQTACNDFTLNNKTYTTSGSFSQKLLNSVGCDSIINLNLVIKPLDTSVTKLGTILFSNESGAAYQWVTCPSFIPILGAISQSHNATINGDYAVILTQNGCIDTSSCVYVNLPVNGIVKIGKGNDLKVYPNPNNGNFKIQSSNPGEYSIIDQLGQFVRVIELNETNNYTVNIGDLGNGVYLVLRFNAGSSSDQTVSQRIIVIK